MEKLLPQNVEAEAAVLGSLLIDPQALAQLDFLQTEDFYREAHRTIYTAATDYYVETGTPPDLIALVDELARRGTLDEIGGASYVSSLANQVPTSRNAVRYARIVQRTALLRRLIEAAGQIAGVAYNEPEAADALGQAEELLGAIRGEWEQREAVGDARPPEQLGIDGQDLLDLDLPEPRWIVPGLVAEGLTLLVGKPKGGKTWMAIALALALICGGVALGVAPVERSDVLYLALEDQPRRFKSRLTKLLGGQPMPRGLRIEWKWPRLDEGGLRKLERYLDAHPETRCVFADTWIKLRGADDQAKGVYRNDYDALDGLRELAARRGIAIVLIHHKNKRLEGGDPLDSVSGSSGVAGAVDNLLILHRERGANEGTLHTTGRDVDDRELALRFDPAYGAWQVLGDAEEHRQSSERQELLRALADAPPDGLTIADAAEAADWEYRRAKTMLWRMERDGDLIKTGRGCYTLPAVTRAELAKLAKPRVFESSETSDARDEELRSSNAGRVGYSRRAIQEVLAAADNVAGLSIQEVCDRVAGVADVPSSYENVKLLLWRMDQDGEIRQTDRGRYATYRGNGFSPVTQTQRHEVSPNGSHNGHTNGASPGVNGHAGPSRADEDSEFEQRTAYVMDGYTPEDNLANEDWSGWDGPSPTPREDDIE